MVTYIRPRSIINNKDTIQVNGITYFLSQCVGGSKEKTGQYVIVKSHYEEVIVVITRVRGGAEDECNYNDILRVQWDLTGFYPIVFDVCHITQ